MDLENLSRDFRRIMRQMYNMEEADFLEAVEWLQRQPPIEKDLERGLLRLFAEIVSPAEEKRVADLLGDLPVLEYNCFQHYQVRKRIGKGRYGKVFLIQDQEKTYALKEIALEDLGSRYVPKLQNEIALARKAGSAGIGPRIYDAYICNHHLYLRMEYLPGPTLATYVERHVLGPRDRKKLLGLVDQMHKMGITHQDLHADNIVLLDTPTGHTFKIIDFGFAETCDTMMRTERRQVEYMLDEIAERDDALLRQWALYRLIADGTIQLHGRVTRPRTTAGLGPKRKRTRRSQGTAARASSRSRTRARA